MKRGTTLAGLLLLSAATVANAAVSEADLQQLQQKLEQALDRIDQLEQRLAAVDATQPAAQAAPVAPVAPVDAIPAAAAVPAPPANQVAGVAAKAGTGTWADRIRIEGDFRYRFQNDDKGDPIDESRDRNRIRARPLIIATLDDELQVGFGLATGENNDPVSTMQTLGDGGADKEVTIDLAYFDWTGIEDASIRGGRFKNTFIVVGGSQLQWDNDWRPEGLDASWSNGTFFAQGAGVYLESDSNKGNEEFSYIVQTGATGKLGPLALTGGVGYTDIGAADKPCLYNQSSSVPGASNLCQGNLTNGVSPDQTYLYNFEVYNLFAQVGMDVSNLPLLLFADYINNTDADDYEQGYLVGTQLGSLKEKGDWQIGYYYEELESNATLGLLTASDFGGGGTNGKGNVISAGYAFSSQTNFQLTYYMVDRNSDHIATINNGQEISVDTLQLDLNFKYK
jgi:hypothetical protein